MNGSGARSIAQDVATIASNHLEQIKGVPSRANSAVICLLFLSETIAKSWRVTRLKRMNVRQAVRI